MAEYVLILKKLIYKFYSITKKLVVNLCLTRIIQRNNIVLYYHELSLEQTKNYQKESSHDSYKMVIENKDKYLFLSSHELILSVSPLILYFKTLPVTGIFVRSTHLYSVREVPMDKYWKV